MNKKNNTSHENNSEMITLINDISTFLNDGILVIDLSGKIKLWNNSMHNMTGIPAEQVLEHKIWRIIRNIYRSTLTPDAVESTAREYVNGILSNDEKAVHKCIMFPTFDSMGRAVTYGINLLKKRINSDSFLYCVISDISDRVTDCIPTEYMTICAPVVKKRLLFKNSTSSISRETILHDDALRASAEKYSRSFHFAPIVLP